MITSRTKLFALLGDPVRHSLSPVMHNAGFRAAGIDAVYVALRCEESALAGTIRVLVANGGGGNVTLPHKAVAASLGVGDARVATLGVANVFLAGADGIAVRNTDVDGVLALFDAARVPRGVAIAVIGTGGSARAVVGAAAEWGVSRLAIASRDRNRATAFGDWAASLGMRSEVLEACQVLVNTTPLGLGAFDPLPVELETLPVASHVIDLTYREVGTTPLVELARSRGVAATDGREMLLVQGVAAWRHWFPGVAPPVEVMRAALDGQMG